MPILLSRPESPVQGAGRRRALGAAAAGHPGLPSHTHTARAAAEPAGDTGGALPPPWTDGDASPGRGNRRDTNGLRRGCGRAEGLSVSPALAVRGESPGARDRGDRARGVVLEGPGMGRASPFAFGCRGTAERGLRWAPASSRLPRPLPRGAEAPQALDSSRFERRRGAASRLPGQAPGRAPRKAGREGRGAAEGEKKRKKREKKKRDDESDFPSESLSVHVLKAWNQFSVAAPPALPLPRLLRRAGDTDT